MSDLDDIYGVDNPPARRLPRAPLDSDDDEGPFPSGADGDDAPPFPESLILDDKDRSYLDGLNDMDRQTILAERGSQLQEWKDRNELRMRAAAIRAAREPAESKPRRQAQGQASKDTVEKLRQLKRDKRLRPDSDDDADVFGADETPVSNDHHWLDSGSESDGERPGGKRGRAASSDEEYGVAKKKTAAGRRSRYSDESAASESDGSSDYSAESEEDDRRARPRGADRSQDMTMAEGLSIQLRRRHFTHLTGLHAFHEAVPGALVRILVGTQDGLDVYKLCFVHEFRKDQPASGDKAAAVYAVDDWFTHDQLTVKIGNHERSFTLDTVSDEPFTADEWDTLVSVYRPAGLPAKDGPRFPNGHACDLTHGGLEPLLDRPLAARALEEVLTYRRRMAPNAAKNATKETKEAERLYKLAVQNKAAPEEVARRKEAWELWKQRGAAPIVESTLSALSKLNQRNRRRNVAESRIAEKRVRTSNTVMQSLKAVTIKRESSDLQLTSPIEMQLEAKADWQALAAGAGAADGTLTPAQHARRLQAQGTAFPLVVLDFVKRSYQESPLL